MASSRKYRRADYDQQLLLPPDIRDWVGEDHLARVFLNIVQKLDLQVLYNRYEVGNNPLMGRPPYDPRMMLTLVLYCMAQRQYSSRAMERMTYDDLGARFIAADLHPDHDSFAAFRVRHRDDMLVVFSEVLVLCHQAGLLELLHVAVDSTVIMGNAAKSKNIPLAEVDKLLAQCEARAAELLAKLEAADADEAEKLRRKLRKVKKKEENLNAAVAFLKSRREEQQKRDQEADEANDTAKAERAAQRAAIGAKFSSARLLCDLSLRDLAERCGIIYQRLSRFEHGESMPNPEELERLKQILGLTEEFDIPARPEHIKAEEVPCSSLYHPYDPDSSFLQRKGHGPRQGYMGQVAVDAKNGIIVAAEVSIGNDDHPSLPSLCEQIASRFDKKPTMMSADTGYASESNFTHPSLTGVDLYVSPKKLAHDPKNPLPATQRMREKLATPEGGARYNERSRIVEPGFAHMKHARNFTRLLRRGHTNAVGDWLQVCSVANMFKLVATGLFR